MDPIINDAKSLIGKLKDEEKELMNTLNELNTELRELDAQKSQVSKENDILQRHEA